MRLWFLTTYLCVNQKRICILFEKLAFKPLFVFVGVVVSIVTSEEEGPGKSPADIAVSAFITVNK